MNLWQCEKCGWKNPVESMKVSERYEDAGDIRIRGFSCGKCGKEYIYEVTDTRLRQKIEVLQRKYKGFALQVKMRKFNEKELKRARKKLDKYREKLQKEMHDMKEKYMEAEHGADQT